MNAFQTCINTSDAVPLYLPKQLYLKPIARINVSIQLPNIKKLGKSVSHWEIMEKLRELVRPDEFTLLKVSKTTIEFVRFEAEVEIKSKLDRVITKLDNKMIKLKNFSDHLMRVRAAQSKSHFPTRHTWDAFFRDAKDMNEMKPGERPDTLHISNVPSKWFLPYHLERDTDNLPSERIFFRIFEKFGHIRNVDIPICDPDRAKMKEHISGLKTTTFEDKEFFEGYVQFKDYIGFTKCMEALKDMKLLRKEDEESVAVNIKVDFDRSKHLSDASIRRREIVRERLVKKRREKEEKDKGKIEEKQKQENAERQMEVNQKQEKETRRRLREEKRKARILEQLKISGSEEINEKIAKEERKLLKAQRKLESIRLVEELFRRIKERKEKDGSIKSSSYDSKTNKSNLELRAYKEQSEMAVFNQKETLHNAVKGRLMLKSVLKGSTRRDYSSSSDEEPRNNHNGNMENNRDRRQEGMDRNPNRLMPPPLEGYDPMWYGYPPPEAYTYAAVPPPNLYQALTPHPAYNMMYSQQRGRGGYRGNYPRRSRGYNNNYRGGYRGPKIPPELEDEYIKYFAKFLVEHKNEHDDRGRRSYDHSSSSHSRSRRSRSRSYDRDRRSRSRDRSRERSHERSRTRGRSCERSRTRERSRSRSRDRSRGRSRERSRDHSRNKTRDRSRDRSDDRARDTSRHKSRSRTKSPDRRRSTSSKKRTRSKSRSPSKNKSSRISRSKTAFTPEKRTELYSRENSRNKSVDSSKFISPKSLRKQRSRSKSWSLPKEGETNNRSWSKSPKKVAN